MAKDKKKGKSKKGALKKDEPLETPFQPTCYDTTDVATSVKLLASPEKHVVLKALIVLDKYTLIKFENCILLCRHNVLSNILDLIAEEDVVILRLSLKILDQLLPVPVVQEEMLSSARVENIRRIFDIFVQATDKIVLEISSNILAKLCVNLDVITRVVTYGPQEKLCATLKSTSDVDTQLNCLKIMRSICNVKDANVWLQRGNFFTCKIPVCYLKSSVQKIRETALEILLKITAYEDSQIHKDVRDCEVIDTALKIVMNVENEANEFVDNAYEVLTNCVKNDAENANYFVNCVDFFKYCIFVENFGCRPNHLQSSAVIFLILTESSAKTRKILFDLSVQETMLSLLRSPDPFVINKVFQCINNMGVNIYCSEVMLTPAVLQKIIDTIKDPNLELVPYKENALFTIYNFLNRNAGSYKLLVKLKGVHPITNLLNDDRVKANKVILTTILDILIVISCKDDSKGLLIERSLYETILKLFVDFDMIISTKSLHILNQFVDSEECRQFFLEMNGINTLLTVLKQTTSKYIIKESLLLARNLIAYQKVGKAFLMSGFMPQLKALQEADPCGDKKFESTINLLLDLYLPLKFNEKGRLEITDVTRNRFYLIRDGYKKDFPFLELIDHQKLSPAFVIYVADFSCPPLQALSMLNSKTQFNTEQNSKENNVIEANSRPSIEVVVNETYVNANIRAPKMYKYVTPPINFGYISPDPYLTRYMHIAKNIMLEDKNISYCFEHKIKILSKIICNNISLPKQYTKLWGHGIEAHHEELKRKMGTNVIPIGYIRIGSMCERAFLFKVLGDKLNIPCTLVRGEVYVYYNEIFHIEDESDCEGAIPFTSRDRPVRQTHCIVDLMEKPGQLLKVGTQEAENYVQGKLKPEANTEQTEYVHTFCLE